MPLHVASFGGGVVREGAADTRGINELVAADSLDLGPRGALIATTDVTPYVVLDDGNTVPAPWTRLYALLSAMPGFQTSLLVAVGEGVAVGGNTVYVANSFAREGMGSPVTGPFTLFGLPVASEGAVVTGYPWPGVWTIPSGGGTAQINVAFVCLGAREGFAPNSNANFGLYAFAQTVGTPGFLLAYPIKDFNALGTGGAGDGVTPTDVGTDSQQLYFRGIVVWNDFVFGWGFDSADATNADGPARVLFCNLGMPLKWGNDNLATSGNRKFTDSDAIVLGDAGEIIRGAIKWNGRLWFGTNQQLHYIAGYGRDSFLTDGATPVAKAFNIVGVNALLEGPDRHLYGVSDQGLWRTTDGATFEPLFRKLVDFDGRSIGYWDCLWTDLTKNPNVYPGCTNQDLIWMVSDRDRRQVVIGIPFCDATQGFGAGLDTVVIRFHVDTGGFTRQVFPRVQYTAAAFLRREGQQRDQRFLGTATPGQTTVQYYGFTASQAASPVLPTILPTVTMGPYAPFGPDGRGQLKRLYLTLAWETVAALPLVFQVTATVDQAVSDTFLLTVGPTIPVGPSVNDLWLDTSDTDTNIGNGTAGAITVAFPEALLRQWASGGFWRQVTGIGTNGLRATIRLPLTPRDGTRVTMQFQCLAANGRFQLEGLGEDPGPGSAVA